MKDMRKTDWLICIALPCLVYFAYQMFREPFITVSSVIVEPAKAGEDPNVTYATEVHRNQRAKWHVEIVGTDCKGEGWAPYKKGSHVRDWKLIAEYIEGDPKDCNLPPGAYPMKTWYTWIFGLRYHRAPPVVVEFTE